MPTWYEFVQKNSLMPEWPYPVSYGKVNEIASDVLIIGGGVGGCRAAIAAAKNGSNVVVAERGMAKRSGAGGAGVDHWHAAVTNPCSKVTPEEYTQAVSNCANGYNGGPARYIVARESWDTLLECEKMGVQIRDIKDEFKGADFRDEKTKLMFAYDYKNKHVLRVWGYNMKPCIYNEMMRLGVDVYNRVMITSLLTEGGKQGSKVVGATGVNTRTGEFYVFKSKATIISTGGATGTTGRLWFFGPELIGSSSMYDINCSCTGEAIAWLAGAEFVCMEQSITAAISGFGYAPYSVANASNTWHGTPIVDANGKEVPWVDVFGRKLQTVKERFLPGQGQKFQLGAGIGLFNYLDEFKMPTLTPDLPERIMKGEFTLPLYADLTRLPELERRVIFGMMVGNEGKTHTPVYINLTRAGFDPEKDLLQAPVMLPEAYRNPNFWGGTPVPHLRGFSGGSLLVDWDLKTSLEGLYAVSGASIFGGGAHGESQTAGRYAGRMAAAYSRACPEPILNSDQIEAEKHRIYDHVKPCKGSIGWKEVNYAIAKVMQDYCGKYKNETTLNLGIRLLKELRENELASAYAANPHELGRLLECHSLITAGELIMQASLTRKASSIYLDFYRLDYPEADPPQWHKLLPIRLKNNHVKVRELPVDYHLKPPFASTHEENYTIHAT
jgi:succinate dehydrogenase/fumarate reductase flavoprotein subunit